MNTPIQAQARLVSLLRLLLLVLALATVLLAFDARRAAEVDPILDRLVWTFAAVLGAAGLLALTVPWARRPWQLVLHLVFDLCWVGLVIYHTGGVASPTVLLVFAVLLIGNLVLPGVLPFVVPALAALVMAANALLYTAGLHPFPASLVGANPHLVEPARIIGLLGVQIAAFFLVDLLGQLLGGRLREQRIFTDELLDQLGEGVVAVDRHGHIAYANDEAVRLLGLPAAPLAGRPVREVLAGGLAPVHAVLTEAQSPVQVRYAGAGGRQLVLRVTDLIGRRGRHLGRTLLVADETRLRLLEENARRAEHLASLGEMAAGIAHEVRNPLTSLRGCAQEIADILAKGGHPDAGALAGIMVSESDRLGRIVSDFLSLSRLRDPCLSRVDLVPLFAELAAMCRARRDLPAGLKLVVEVAPGTPAPEADGDQLRQVLTNLVNNSLDAVLHSSFPSLSCTARRAPADNPLGVEAVEMVVSDNGEGIPPELQERVFTPFFSTKSQGTGLGLSLVSRIVRAHEGILSLDSCPGLGTTVVIHLPAHSHTRVFKRALGGA